MTPAERFAAKKVRKPASTGRKTVWVCRVRELRESLGLTLRDVERATGVSNATVCHIEQGFDPQLSTARKLAEFFGTTVEHLWPKGKSTRRPNSNDVRM